MDYDAVQEKLLGLRIKYISQMEGNVEQLQQQWKAICNASATLEVGQEFQRQLHNMRGTAKTFGCPEMGEIATAIENLLKLHTFPESIVSADVQQKVTGFLHSLAAVAKVCVIHGASMTSTPAPLRKIVSPQTSEKSLLYIVDDDPAYSQVLTEQLSVRFDCKTCPSESAFTQAIEQRLPDAVIMDMMLPEGQLAGADAAMKLTSLHKVPVVFVSVRDDQEARLAAVRAGASGYFIKQDEPSRMIALLEQLITRHPSHPYRVLLIDDDVELSSLYQLKMQGVGIDVRVINLPANAIAKLQKFMPDLILLDINMPEINGLELGALIRQYPAYNHIPIIYLSAASGEKIHLAAMQLGGDDFLSKPLDPDYLCQLLLARLARVRVTRQGEYRLQEALSELNYIQEGLNKHSIVSIADLAGRITYANEKFSEISGYSHAELIGQNHRMLKSGLHPPEFYQEMWSCIASGKVWNGEITNRSKDGHMYTVLSSIIPVLDDYGLPQRYLSVRTDITQIKKLNEELDKEKARLSLSLEATNTGLWEWNITLNQTLYDKNWCDLLGYPYPVEMSWALQIHPEDYQDVFPKLRAVLDQETTVYQSEHRKQNAAGGWDWVLESGRVVEADAEGFPARIVGTMQIINERKEAEAISLELREHLNQAIKMEAVGHLTAGIAHDFNNILGAMLGYIDLSQMLLANNKDIPVEKLGRYLGMVKSSGTRAKELIAQMLTFSRLSPEGEGEQQAPVTALTPIVKEVVSLLRSSIPRTVELNYRIEAENLKARIQPVHLHQIILNLGINARDAMGEYGQIVITLSRNHSDNQLCSSCNMTYTGDYARLTVQDSGSGIPGHILSKVFEPFFTTKGVGKGTGMGLSVVHGLVHGLGGHIQVESSAEKGTAFNILLPLASADASAEEKVDDKPAGSIKGAMIMVVDDELSMTAMLHEFLSTYGAHVVSFSEPVLALEAFTQNANSIDLVITDETMPGLSGMHLAQQMLKIKPALPIILCTGFSDHATAESVAKIGITGFFHKPLRMNELVRKVAELLPAKNGSTIL